MNLQEKNRSQQRHAFVDAFGWKDAYCQALTADASFRRYFRLTKGDKSLLLMDAARPHEDIDTFLDMTEHLRKLGFSVPKIHQADQINGLALIEDFGDGTFTNLLGAGRDEEKLYLLATDVLASMHKNKTALECEVPPYDMKLFIEEVDLFIDWYVPAVTGTKVSDTDRENYNQVWGSALMDLSVRRETLVLRDYHVDNLMGLDEREGIRACGLLDYQDAVLGPRMYDLVSLVEDARRDISTDLRQKILHRYAEKFGEMDDKAKADLAILGAQRHAKVIGIFVRLSKRDGKDIYLEHLPRVVRLLKRCLDHPKLRDVKKVIEGLTSGCSEENVFVQSLSIKKKEFNDE